MKHKTKKAPPSTAPKETKCTSLYANQKELSMFEDLKIKRGYKSDSSILRRGLYDLHAKECGA
ncbi:MAG: hypothetical protein WCI51_01075 [Lentisphaerota bacterium]